MNHNFKQAIDFKLQSASYHYDNLINVMENFQDDIDKIVAISSEFTAYMLVYQSTFDVLAQLININRNLNLNPDRLCFSTIIKHSSKITDLQSELVALKKYNHYINDYCNTVKHRNLISVKETQVQQTAMIGVGVHMGTQIYYHIDSFVKNNRKHPEKLLPEYTNELQEKLPEIIKSILSQI